MSPVVVEEPRSGSRHPSVEELRGTVVLRRDAIQRGIKRQRQGFNEASAVDASLAAAAALSVAEPSELDPDTQGLWISTPICRGHAWTQICRGLDPDILSMGLHACSYAKAGLRYTASFCSMLCAWGLKTVRPRYAVSSALRIWVQPLGHMLKKNET